MNTIFTIVSGPSGSGKGTVLAEVLRIDPSYCIVVSHTTRPMRTGEVHGKEYHFVSKEQFMEIANADGFLEYAKYNGNWYGTSLASLEEATSLCDGKVILEIECKGAAQLRRNFDGRVFSVFIKATPEVLRERLRRRGRDSEAQIAQRVRISYDELRRELEYDCVIDNNGTVEDSAQSLIDAIRKRKRNW